MNLHSISHRAPAQTAPEIYAQRVQLPPGSSPEGRRYQQWVIGLTLSGGCRYRIEENYWEVGPGDLTLFRPRHRVSPSVCADGAGSETSPASRRGPQGWDVIYAVFHPYPHWLPWLNAMEYTNGVSITHIDEPWRADMRNLLLRVGEIYQSGALLRDDETLNALETVLIKLRRYSEEKRCRIDERVQASLDLIHRRFDEPISMTQIAQAAGISLNWLSTLFAGELGSSPAQYLERVRLSRAAEQLRFGEEPVGTVATAVGYQDPFYFARRFRLRYGQSPSEYRKAARI